MATITRRSFIEMAVALGATAAWEQPTAAQSKVDRHERRDFYPAGVASGDPESDRVVLWTRRSPVDARFVEFRSVAAPSSCRHGWPRVRIGSRHQRCSGS